MAAKPSATVRSGVVWMFLMPPPADTAMENAAAEALSGISTSVTVSYWPKARYREMILPPSLSMTELIASSLSWGFFVRASHDSDV